MALPYPININNNDYIAAKGTTWLDVDITQILNNNGHFHNYEPQLHAWMKKNGRWAILSGQSNKSYFCLDSNLLINNLGMLNSRLE